MFGQPTFTEIPFDFICQNLTENEKKSIVIKFEIKKMISEKENSDTLQEVFHQISEDGVWNGINFTFFSHRGVQNLYYNYIKKLK